MRARTRWLRHRGVLVGAALVALAAGSSAIAVWATYRLPAPENAQGRDLMRWLVTRDLQKENKATRWALVRQLEIYLGDTQDLGAATAEMNDERRAMLEENVAVLLPDWLGLDAERYAKTEPNGRDAMLDQQLVLVERVGEMSQLWNGSAARAADSNPIFELVVMIERIVAEAASDEQPQLATYVRAMKLRWFTTTDLSELSSANLAELAKCVENELRAGLVVSETESDFDPVGSRQFWRNVDLLAEIWFHRQVQSYSTLSVDARSAYIHKLVADVMSWPVVKQQLESPLTTTASFASPLALLTNNPLAQIMKQMATVERRVNGWIRRAPQTSQPPMRQFVVDTRSAIQTRYLKQLVPGAFNSNGS